MSNAQTAADDVVKRVSAAPHLGVSAEDAAILLAAPTRSLMMEKLLAIHYNAIRDFANALDKAKLIFERERNAEGAKNIALLLRQLQRHDEGIAFANQNAELFEPITLQDTLCMLHRSNEDIAGAVRHGTRALELKAAANPAGPPIHPRTRPFDPTRPERNVIVFSLWGQDPRYLTGAVTNAIVARYLYPGWTVRFYVDQSVPQEVRTRLAAEGAKVLRVHADWPATQYGLFWRFFVEDDEEVDLYLIRDADSVMNIKERAAVEDWLASGKAFHVMRDWPAHSELILAGMWGAHRGNIGNMVRRIRDHVASEPKTLNYMAIDQHFLREQIWPIVCQDAMVHDDHFEVPGVTRFRDEFHLPGRMHIGQNDWVQRAAARSGPSG